MLSYSSYASRLRYPICSLFSNFIKSGCFSIVFVKEPPLDRFESFGEFLSADKAKSSNSDPTISPN